MVELPQSVISRLEQRVDRSGGPEACWPWIGARTKAGYGVMGVGHSSLIYTHRAAFELANGPLQPGLEVCHRCDNPACCNPAHLFAANHRRNMLDSKQKGRDSPPPQMFGEDNCNAKITDSQACAILELRKSGLRYREIAEQTGISAAFIGRLCRRQTRAYLPDHHTLGLRYPATDHVSPTRRRRGEAHPGSKLTTAHVLEIRQSLDCGVSSTALAGRYNVSRQTIWRIATRAAWRHLR